MMKIGRIHTQGLAIYASSLIIWGGGGEGGSGPPGPPGSPGSYSTASAGAFSASLSETHGAFTPIVQLTR